MSSQHRAGRQQRNGNRNRQRNGNSGPANGRGQGSPKGKSQQSKNQQQSFLSRLEKEYNPPFCLGTKWQSKEFYKVKLPHPFFPAEKETVQFPILESSNKLSDRALFYADVLDQQEQVNFD